MQKDIRFVKYPEGFRKAYTFDNSEKEDNPSGIIKVPEPEKKVFRRRLLSRWRFKSCPKCHGDLCSNYGEDFTCFQCGCIVYSWINKGGKENGKTEES
jgi:hypothetical protein